MEQLEQLRPLDIKGTPFTREELISFLGKYEILSKQGTQAEMENRDRLEYLYSIDRFDYEGF